MRRLLVLLLLLSLSPMALHALDSVPKGEFRERRVKLGEKLSGGVALVLAAQEPPLEFMSYRQDEDFFYLTGWDEPGAALLVIGAGPAGVVPRLDTPLPAHPYREILFLPVRNRVNEMYTGAKLDAASVGAAAAIGVDAVMPLTSLPEVMASFVGEDRRRARQIWDQADLSQARATMEFVASTLGIPVLPPVQDVRDLTADLRTVKSPAELELLRKASEASIAAQLAGMAAIRPGVRERTVEGIEVQRLLEEGCERASYPSIVGSGANSTVLHYSENSATMQKGDVVVIDSAGEYSMYASDITRTMPVDGHFSARQKEIYDIVLGAQRAAMSAFVAGKFRLGGINDRRPEVTDSLDKIAYDYINTHGKDLHGQPLGKYFIHGLGHSVGIDVHDPINLQTKLNKGMVFTIEPGVYIPEEHLGVRIEDVVYVDGDGRLVDLIAKLPHETTEVESAMRRPH